MKVRKPKNDNYNDKKYMFYPIILVRRNYINVESDYKDKKNVMFCNFLDGLVTNNENNTSYL